MWGREGGEKRKRKGRASERGTLEPRENAEGKRAEGKLRERTDVFNKSTRN